MLQSASEHSFVNVVANCLKKQLAEGSGATEWTNTGVKILLSFSGGPDSTSLLLALCRIRAQAAHILVEAAHINHGLRGEESDKDEMFCQDLCNRLQIPLHVLRSESDKSDKSESLNKTSFDKSENALRDRRYSYLRRLCREQHIDFVLTGHTQDDQAETVLFRLVRGTSLSGASGIASVSPLDQRTVLLRPLLTISRQKVLSFLCEENVIAREDQSNRELIYSRNFIRHKILNELNTRFGGASERISRFAASASLDNEYIEQQVEVCFTRLNLGDDVWDCSSFNCLHESLQNRLLALSLQSRSIEVNFERIQTLKSLLGLDKTSRITLNENWDVVKAQHHIRWLLKSDDALLLKAIDFEIRLKIPGITPVVTIGKVFAAQLMTGENLDENFPFPSSDSLEAVVDLSRAQDLGDFLSIRRRRAGDFIQPLGRHEKVGLKKYLHTRKAAAQVEHLQNLLDKRFSVRHCIVIAAGSEILWIPGIGLSEKLRVDVKPTHQWAIVPLSENFALA